MREESIFVLVDDSVRPRRPRRPSSPRPEPTTTLSVAVPSSLADELKHTVSVLPGQSLDALMAEALRRVLASHGPLPAPRRRSRSSGDDSLIILAT
ncbi:MAG: hypothetical protein H0W83_11945 [Planctomycetes bacterium]|nr:hypothetical protein [Planctomycetota bacterium]